MKRDATTFKKTKIIATIGPASQDKIHDLLAAGVNGIRLNFSHGSHASHLKNLTAAREAAKDLDRSVAIIQDLSGPKIRLGELPESGVTIKRGEVWSFSFADDYDAELAILPTQYNFASEVKAGEQLFLRDGQIKLIIQSAKGGIVTAKALNGGAVKSHHGINLPDTKFKNSVITDKDREDVGFALAHDVDYVALSFVQSAHTVDELRKLLKPAARDIKITAKIETRAAIENLEQVMSASDAIMIARGDLGIEIGAENVPIVGRQIIEMARVMKKPVIMATQMLESMMTSTQPSRAEANDVSTAVTLGVDAVMLSGETAIGQYPVETVQMMKRIILKTEQYTTSGTVALELSAGTPGNLQQKTVISKPNLQKIHDTTRIVFEQHQPDTQMSLASRAQISISLAAITLAEQLGVKLILAETLTGSTAYSLASLRPSVPIVMASPNKTVCNQLAIVWGGKPFLVPRQQAISGLVLTTLHAKGNVKKGDLVVSAFGKHHNVAGGTDTIRLLTI